MESRKLGLYTLNKTVEKTEGKFTQAVTYETITTIFAGRDERSKGNTLSYERDDDAFSCLFSFLVFFFEKRERENGKSQFSLVVVSPRGTF